MYHSLPPALCKDMSDERVLQCTNTAANVFLPLFLRGLFPEGKKESLLCCGMLGKVNKKYYRQWVN